MEHEPFAVLIPLINPNEPEAQVAEILVTEGKRVASGELLCVLETTKTTAELEAEQDGYVSGLHFSTGQTARAGEVFCYLAPSPGWTPPPQAPEGTVAAGEAAAKEAPAGLRITRPALELARQAGLDLESLPRDALITEALVRSRLEPAGEETADAAQAPFDPAAIVVYGGGGHGKILIDLLRAQGVYRIEGLIDDGRRPGESVMGVPVLGGAEVLPELHTRGIRLAANAVGGIGNLNVRLQVFDRLAEAGFACPPLVHPRAVLEPGAHLSAGAQVMALAYVGSVVNVGFGCIVNTGAIVSHDCVLEDYVNLSPGAILAGEVRVGRGALIGMGATVNLQVRVGAGARIGNGATVKRDVPANAIVPAGSIWPPAGS